MLLLSFESSTHQRARRSLILHSEKYLYMWVVVVWWDMVVVVLRVVTPNWSEERRFGYPEILAIPRTHFSDTMKYSVMQQITEHVCVCVCARVHLIFDLNQAQTFSQNTIDSWPARKTRENERQPKTLLQLTMMAWGGGGRFELCAELRCVSCQASLYWI